MVDNLFKPVSDNEDEGIIKYIYLFLIPKFFLEIISGRLIRSNIQRSLNYPKAVFWMSYSSFQLMA